ncbi:hypothetical protein Zmor_012630 [Zophobas morio]|uniref:Uncharacterized protein n=1 Tax=Zophobas morio TaxID=2755281 RepID=A0AA38MEH8_9CUCU|nr:hypothetical protein Zmor_012630 [Zophobas morio]
MTNSHQRAPPWLMMHQSVAFGCFQTLDEHVPDCSAVHGSPPAPGTQGVMWPRRGRRRGDESDSDDSVCPFCFSKTAACPLRLRVRVFVSRGRPGTRLPYVR